MIPVRPAWLAVFLFLLPGPAGAETPLEAVKDFEKLCAAKDEVAAMARIAEPVALPERDADYFRQKAKSLIEASAREGWKTEAVSEKTEGGLAAVMLVSTGPEGVREVEILYLSKTGKRWRILPFSNWRKLPLGNEEKAGMEKLEAWAEAEEKRLSPAPEAGFE